MLEALLHDGADANAATKLKGWSPLHFAAYKGRLDVAALLTRMVGSIQALDEQLRESRQEIAALRAAVKQLS